MFQFLHSILQKQPAEVFGKFFSVLLLLKATFILKDLSNLGNKVKYLLKGKTKKFLLPKGCFGLTLCCMAVSEWGTRNVT